MAQRFKELNKNAICFALKIRRVVCFSYELESFIQMVFFHKIDGSFYSSIETNGLVEIQEYIKTKSFELSKKWPEITSKLPRHFANVFFGVF